MTINRERNMEERPRRSYGSKPDRERPKRSYGSRPDGDRPKRSYGSRPDGDRPKRSYGSDRPDGERPRRSYGSRPDGDRPKRSYGSKPDGDRPKRSYGSKPDEERPRRSYGSRPDGDRPKRSYGSDRPDGERPRRSYGSKPDGDRPKRSYGSDRPDGERPRRSYGSRPDGDRPKRSYGSDRPDGERPRRSYGSKPDGDRPKRSYGSDRPDGERPRRSYGSDRPDGERPRRSYGSKPDGGFAKKGRKTKPSGSDRSETPDGIRLNRFISNSGICSRREADDYIKAGLVSVNGQIVTEMGVRVTENDDIRFNGERLRGEEKVYIVMNKPKDFVTTLSDPHAEKTVLDLIRNKCPQRVYPVGRLDKATTGVLLLTNDGELAEKLTHPSNEHKKIYHVHLDKNLKTVDFNKLLEGFELEDGFIQADSLSYVDEDNSQVGIAIHSGRNRIIRRMFEHLDYKIKKLDRVFFAGLTKKNISRGEWRFLTEKEVSMLKMGAYE